MKGEQEVPSKQDRRLVGLVAQAERRRLLARRMGNANLGDGTRE